MEETAPKFYKSSGKVSFLILTPLLGVSIFVSFFMSLVLLICDTFNFYYFIFIPFLVALPVFGMLFVTLHFGTCRNRIFGVICGLLCMSVFYFGFWTFGYLANVVQEGPEAVKYMEEKAGTGGVIGYIIYRCKTNVVSDDTYNNDKPQEPDGADIFGSIMFYSLEFLLLFGAAIAMGLTLPSRVFYESAKKWASSKEIRFAPHELARTLEAIRNNNWSEFMTIPKMPKIGNNQMASFLSLKIEYLKNSKTEPIYVTLAGGNMSKDPVAKAEGAKGLSTAFIKKQQIAKEYLPALSQAFPEIGLNIAAPPPSPPTAENTASATPAQETIQSNTTMAQNSVTPAAPAVSQPKYSSGFKGLLEQLGVSQPEFTGPDFREQAALASQQVLRSSGDIVSPTDINRSLCIPVDENEKIPTNEVSGINYWGFLLFFLGFLGGAVLLAIGEDKPDPIKTPLTISGGVILISGITGFFLSLVWRKLRAPSRLLNRTNSLFDRYTNQKKEVLRIEDPQTYNVHKRTPEDVVYCLFDQQNSRLLMEGCNYRYIVKGEDVTKLEPMESGQVVSIHLSYKIKETELPLVIYKASAGGTVLNPLFTMNAAKSFTKKIKKALNLEN